MLETHVILTLRHVGAHDSSMLECPEQSPDNLEGGMHMRDGLELLEKMSCAETVTKLRRR